MVAVSAPAALPYLAPEFPGEPRIILPQPRGVADWKISVSETKLKDKFSSLVNPLCTHLRNPSPSKESLGHRELMKRFLRAHEINKKGTRRGFDWSLTSRHRHKSTRTPLNRF